VIITLVQGVTVAVALAASAIAPRRRRAARRVSAVAVIIATGVAVTGKKGIGIVELIGAVLLIASFGAIISRIGRHRKVDAQTLLGAISCYLLFGLIYAFLYAGIAHVQDKSIFTASNQESFSDYLFFSYTTLTTVGYGDLVPAHAVVRTVAILEALMGQIFLVTVVARLVALWTPSRRDAREAETRDH
jgi:hypothetical protein